MCWCATNRSATHAAEGYARSTGKVGVVLVTSGPGATNAVTGLTDALMDSIPLVVITGQVADPFDRHRWLPGMRHGRNYSSLHQRTTGWCVTSTICRASCMRRSRSPPSAVPAPCWWIFPRTSNSKKGGSICRPPDRCSTAATGPGPSRSRAAIVRAVEMMAEAKRPVFYTGGGLINAGPAASRTLRELVDLTGFSRHLDPDGAGRLSGLPAGMAGHAGDARHLGSQPRHA